MISRKSLLCKMNRYFLRGGGICGYHDSRGFCPYKNFESRLI
nr:MAG TPA: hypothetical protein [Caudoviricetes sp.]